MTEPQRVYPIGPALKLVQDILLAPASNWSAERDCDWPSNACGTFIKTVGDLKLSLNGTAYDHNPTFFVQAGETYIGIRADDYKDVPEFMSAVREFLRQKREAAGEAEIKALREVLDSALAEDQKPPSV